MHWSKSLFSDGNRFLKEESFDCEMKQKDRGNFGDLTKWNKPSILMTEPGQKRKKAAVYLALNNLDHRGAESFLSSAPHQSSTSADARHSKLDKAPLVAKGFLR